MSNLRITLSFEVDASDLATYEATTIEEAAEHQKEWIENGSADLIELVANAEDLDVQVEVVS